MVSPVDISGFPYLDMIYGGFLKRATPKSSEFNVRMFHCKPSSFWATPINGPHILLISYPPRPVGRKDGESELHPTWRLHLQRCDAASATRSVSCGSVCFWVSTDYWGFPKSWGVLQNHPSDWFSKAENQGKPKSVWLGNAWKCPN